MKVYVLQHSYEVAECGHDITKFIGVYTTRDAAQAAIERLSLQPGFRDSINSFCVDEYEVDQDHWAEGYERWE